MKLEEYCMLNIKVLASFSTGSKKFVFCFFLRMASVDSCDFSCVLEHWQRAGQFVKPPLQNESIYSAQIFCVSDIVLMFWNSCFSGIHILCVLLHIVNSFYIHINILTLSNQGLKKLSYAEVCQKLAKDPPPAQPPSPSPPTMSPIQPLQELKVNRVEEPRPNPKCSTDKPQKSGDRRPTRQPLHSFRGPNGQVKFGGGGLKVREQPRGLNTGKGFSRRSGKEQNIPPRVPQ